MTVTRAAAMIVTGAALILGTAGCVSAATPYTASCKELGPGWVSYQPADSGTVLRQVKSALACGSTLQEKTLTVTWQSGGTTEIRGHYTFSQQK